MDEFKETLNDPELKISRRHLPHWKLEGSTYFITFRLRNGIMDNEERKLVLDHAISGDPQYYNLISAVVLSNHVHLLLTPAPAVDLSRITRGIKGVTARKINQRRGTRGSVWQDESFDRIIRDENELNEKLNYMWGNPVKAGLVDDGLTYEGFYLKDR